MVTEVWEPGELQFQLGLSRQKGVLPSSTYFLRKTKAVAANYEQIKNLTGKKNNCTSILTIERYWLKSCVWVSICLWTTCGQNNASGQKAFGQTAFGQTAPGKTQPSGYASIEGK